MAHSPRPFLTVRGVCKTFAAPSGTTAALTEIDLDTRRAFMQSLT
jgi:hypothetical protein